MSSPDEESEFFRLVCRRRGAAPALEPARRRGELLAGGACSSFPELRLSDANGDGGRVGVLCWSWEGWIGEEGERLRDAGSTSSLDCEIVIAVFRSTDSRRRATNPTGFGGIAGRWGSSASEARATEAARSRSWAGTDVTESTESARLELDELQSSTSALDILRTLAVIRRA